MVHFRPAQPRSTGWLWVILGVTCGVSVLVVWLLVATVTTTANLQYRLTATHVIVAHGGDEEQIARNEIVRVELIEEPTGAVRRFGTNAPGVKLGSWSFDQTGPITLWATTYRPLVVIETAERKVGISPDDAWGFVQALQGGGTGDYPPVKVEGSYGGLVAFTVIFSVLTLGSMGFLIFYLVRLTRSLSYELGPDELLVHGGLRPIRIPYKEITAVERVEPKGQPWRIAGSSMPGLYWGRFSWQSLGRSLRIYATTLNALVIVRTEKQTFGLSPEDMDCFVRELGRRIPQLR